MNTHSRRSNLRGLVGHLVIDTETQQRELELLYRSLSESEIPETSQSLTPGSRSIERADLFFEDRIPTQRREQLDRIADRRSEADAPPKFRFYRREVSVRDALIPGSVPDWAAGARLDRSVGPFRHQDGRQFWYDFFPIDQFQALYIQGIAEPVLLYQTERIRLRPTIPERPVLGRRNTVIPLRSGSIWIMSRFLAPNAPTGKYTGLRINGGSINLSTTPSSISGQQTVGVNTIISLSLELQQAEVTDAQPASAYGQDARDLRLSLPRRLAFRFSAQGRSIERVGDMTCQLYGQSHYFEWLEDQQVTYDPTLQHIVFPFRSGQDEMMISQVSSPFNQVSGTAGIERSAWLLTVASIDINQPTAADGNGTLLLQTAAGINARWTGLQGSGLALPTTQFLLQPGQISIAAFQAVGQQSHHELAMWKDAINPFGTTIDLRFSGPILYLYSTAASGNELLIAQANADLGIDRPVQVNGHPPAIRTLDSLFIMAVSDAFRLFYLLDENLIQDDAAINNEDPVIPDRMALALHNALFKVQQPNACLIFASLSEDQRRLDAGLLWLTFGLLAYIPTLPDPYAARLGRFRDQLRRRDATTGAGLAPTTNLVCRVFWEPPTEAEADNAVTVSFHFAPLTDSFVGIPVDPAEVSSEVQQPSGRVEIRKTASPLDILFRKHPTLQATTAVAERAVVSEKPLPQYEGIWRERTDRYRQHDFALLDVSSNADQFGVSFQVLSPSEARLMGASILQPAAFPFQVEGMDVIGRGRDVRTFTVPPLAWEPLLNITPPQVAGDPPFGYNFYPNDGGPLQIINAGEDTVAIAPLPQLGYLLQHFRDDTPGFRALSFSPLPFGLQSMALLKNTYEEGNSTRRGSELTLNTEEFGSDLRGSLQLRIDAGASSVEGEGDLFRGRTIQLNNIQDVFGNDTGDSTLGRDVTEIFNGEFFPEPGPFLLQRGVPVERMDVSGYGASMFSNWLNPDAAFAETSQAKFNVLVGRTNHEVIQVVSMVYPWGIKVVRTITIFRVGSGYGYRHDSGWRAESAGQFDFRFFVNVLVNSQKVKQEEPTPFEIHPGIIKGLYNVENIVPAKDVDTAEGIMIAPMIVDVNKNYVPNPDPNNQLAYKLQPLYLDADVEVEHPTNGAVEKAIDGKIRLVVPSKRILGYVQIAPIGMPLTADGLQKLVQEQLGSIGGPMSCEVDLAQSKQRMRLTRFDFNNSFAANGSSPVFVVAGRGSVLLPKDGSWSMVKHERSTGAVSPVPADLSLPVIREGFLQKDGKGQKLSSPVGQNLLRVANPTELLRQPADGTINYGFLQSTDTQKALLLNPSFEQGRQNLFSKTPPLFADAFRICNSKSVFPNIGTGDIPLGDIQSGDAISLITKANQFAKGNLQDLGQDVWNLMELDDVIDGVQEQAMKLLRQELPFDLPTEFDLINLGDGNFRIYLKYEGKDGKGNLDFDINSKLSDIGDQVAETWKSKMSSISIVVDLAGIDALMTIRGDWSANKGSQASYPKPDIQFAPELQPVIDILQILQSLQDGNYGDAVSKGLKLAMSNKAGSWEYKFEASKEIPVLRFPIPDSVYNSPQTPFKLECGLTLGAYFNAAVKVTTDAKELLPSAGGLLGFYGRLSVMCVSVGGATVYALGQLNLDVAADTKIGPSLKMAFGFGAQIVVGLPVAGNVSVLFMVGTELFAAAGIVEITAILLFEGHAEILGGLVSITIRIEARGTISRKQIGGESRTDMIAQVTFGLDISIFLVINISFTTSWSEQRRVA